MSQQAHSAELPYTCPICLTRVKRLVRTTHLCTHAICSSCVKRVLENGKPALCPICPRPSIFAKIKTVVCHRSRKNPDGPSVIHKSCICLIDPDLVSPYVPQECLRDGRQLRPFLAAPNVVLSPKAAGSSCPRCGSFCVGFKADPFKFRCTRSECGHVFSKNPAAGYTYLMRPCWQNIS